MANTKKNNKAGLLVKLARSVINNSKLALIIWASIMIAGGAVYTSVIKREGFPPISFPLSFVNGSYLVDDVQKVDSDVVIPINESLKDIDEITGIQSTSRDNFFNFQISFDEDLTSDQGTEIIKSKIAELNLPQQANLSFSSIDPGSFLFEYDLLVHVYTENPNYSLREIDLAAEAIANDLAQLSIVDRAEPRQNTTVTQNENGQPVEFQAHFNRIGLAGSQGVEYFPATVIGIDGVEGEDLIKLSEDVNQWLMSYNSGDSSKLGDYKAVIGADFASEIEGQISFLESNMATGLIAVSIVSFLLISWRASIITALFMLTVMSATILSLYLIGYTLNTITLFALILSLGLFVDDATIVVEALDVSRKSKRKPIEAVSEAVKKVGKASLAGTLTTVLVFAILATPTGILGEFIRLIPITVVLALLISFILSMTVIPLLSKYLLLKTSAKNKFDKVNPVSKIENYLAKLSRSNIDRIHTRRGKAVASLSILLSIFMFMYGMYMFGFKVDQNTFPPSKDSDQIATVINYSEGTSVAQAEAIAKQVETVVLEEIGDQMVHSFYGPEFLPDSRTATIVIELIPFTDRDVKSPQLVDKLQNRFDSIEGMSANLVATTIDNGPPSDQFPFAVRVVSDDQASVSKALNEISIKMLDQTLETLNGTKINILESRINGVDGSILRSEGQRYGVVRFSFDNENPTLVTMLAKERFNEIFNSDALVSLGLSPDNIEFDAGQEGDFQDSFNTLLIAIPISLLLMYLLLAIQFKSIVQPFLILLAIPFTIFGVAFGLYVTNNSASFFALVGFIGLIGIAVNNTIMLTDYANQERRDGKPISQAIANAAQKRFRPLLATSITTMVALLPLALSDPFWESLAFTIIFGLLSSTFLVIVSFPYYYLILEFIREKINAKFLKRKKHNA